MNAWFTALILHIGTLRPEKVTQWASGETMLYKPTVQSPKEVV